MEFEWDESKRLANLRKHGIDFIDVPAVFYGDTVTVEDDRYGYGEQRFIAFGLLQGRVIAVVYKSNFGVKDFRQCLTTVCNLIDNQ
jgi:uncharacterized DUF497 family protein